MDQIILRTSQSIRELREINQQLEKTKNRLSKSIFQEKKKILLKIYATSTPKPKQKSGLISPS